MVSFLWKTILCSSYSLNSIFIWLRECDSVLQSDSLLGIRVLSSVMRKTKCLEVIYPNDSGKKSSICFATVAPEDTLGPVL